MTVATNHREETEATILARVLGEAAGRFSPELARHVLNLSFNDADKARMHDLAVRNQSDALSPAKKDELLAFIRAGDVLAVLKSKARLTLKAAPARPDVP